MYSDKKQAETISVLSSYLCLFEMAACCVNENRQHVASG